MQPQMWNQNFKSGNAHSSILQISKLDTAKSMPSSAFESHSMDPTTRLPPRRRNSNCLRRIQTLEISRTERATHPKILTRLVNSQRRHHHAEALTDLSLTTTISSDCSSKGFIELSTILTTSSNWSENLVEFSSPSTSAKWQRISK